VIGTACIGSCKSNYHTIKTLKYLENDREMLMKTILKMDRLMNSRHKLMAIAHVTLWVSELKIENI
jgi:hypothetical protein